MTTLRRSVMLLALLPVAPTLAATDDAAPAPAFRAAMSFDEPAPASAPPAFGQADSWWWSVSGGVADDFDGATDFNLNVAARYFIAEDVEFTVELGAWYYSQPGDDAVGLNPSMIFRWHFVNRQHFTLFADAGIGVFFATDDVPAEREIDGEAQDGTPFGFTPRAGIGATFRLDESSGVRAEIGLRWAHASNARLTGDDDNPARDSAMLYVGVIVPF